MRSRAVLPPVLPFAVDGVTPADLADHPQAGCTGAGFGSALCRPGQTAVQTAQQARTFVVTYRAATAGVRS
jgi:2-dehydro-3-deoxyphosphogalactonate aldolase